jgi:hypothetical protein
MDNETFTQKLALEVLNKLYAFYSGVTSDRAALTENLIVFVNDFIQLVIARELADYDRSASKKAQMHEVFTNYTALKDTLQQQIGHAFSAAMLKYAGQEINYLCLITQADEPANTFPC